MSDPFQPSLLFQPAWCRVTLSSIGDAVMTADTEGRVTFLNSVAESLTGWTQAEAEGVKLETVFDIINESTRVAVESPTIRALRDGVIVGLANHTLLISKDGTERPIDDSAAPIRNDQGEVAGVVLVFRDVTERRDQENSLTDALKYAKSIIATLREPFVTLDKSMRVRTANDAYFRYFQTSKIDTEGKSFWKLDDGIWDTADLREKLDRVMIEHEVLNNYETKLTFTKSGNRILLLNARRFVSLNSFPDLILLSMEDVTERRQLERAKLQAEISADLHRRKDQFLAMLSHELRNPLAPIQNAIHILRLKQDDDPIQQQARTIIERQVGQMTVLVNDLLEVSRITTGRIQLRIERIMLQGVVENAVQAVQSIVDTRKQTLRVTQAKEPIWLNGDASRLQQVLVNLLNNASKYSDEGGEIAIELTLDGGEAVVEVTDNGVGIAPDVLPRIFDLFTQADRTIDRSEGGLGIGLALVERLVTMHDGSVEARSEPGVGSRFIVRLPASVAPSTKPHGGAAPASEPRATGLRVLVVDDNIDAAATLAMLLKATGHQVQTAHDGPSAVEAAREYRPNLILLDIGLPGMNGFEVAKKVRSELALGDVVLVALTGYGQDEDIALSRDAGFDHHLVKPANFNEVKKILTSVAQAAG